MGLLVLLAILLVILAVGGGLTVSPLLWLVLVLAVAVAVVASVARR